MNKKRITITINSNVLKKLDEMIDGQNIRSRSHAIESVLSDALNIDYINTALILAGGRDVIIKGNHIPRALVPVHDKPILEYHLKTLKKNGIENIFLSVGTQEDDMEKIKKQFGDGNKFGVNLKYLLEHKPLGTAGPLSLIKDNVNSTFVMLNVDTLINPDVQNIYDFHKKHKKMATVLLTTVDDTSTYGVVRMTGNQVIEFVEKPKSMASSKRINAGFNVFEPEVINMVPKRKFMIEELFQKLIGKGELIGYQFDDFVMDVVKQR